MIKTLTVNIDKSTWPVPGPSFPTTFHSGSKEVSIDITAMLLLVGHLTTPTLSVGVSLSELWACVRYYYALAPCSDMRLTEAFAELDSHQKSILSDDFGMGVPISWLIDPLKLSAWCDGREFAKRFAALTLAAPPKVKKQGPGKSPDFVFLDETGRYHVVECKGTQSGASARNKQLSHITKGGQPSGAVVQKMMIILKPRFQGQRLACGVTIARDGAPGDTDLEIRDPEGALTIEVKDGQEIYAEDAVVRGSMARVLRAAGLPASASAMAAPSGLTPEARPLKVRSRERVRARLVNERRGRAEAEIATAIVELAGDLPTNWVTRRSVIALPRPLEVDGKAFRSVSIEEAVSIDVLKELQQGGLREGVIAETAEWLPKALGRLRLKSDGVHAELLLGDVFRSSMTLRAEAP